MALFNSLCRLENLMGCCRQTNIDWLEPHETNLVQFTMLYMYNYKPMCQKVTTILIRFVHLFYFDRTYVVSYCGRDKLAKIGRDHNQKWPKSQSQPVHNDHFLPPDLTGQSAPVRYVVHCTALAPNVFFDHFLGWQRRQDNTWRKYEATVWRLESGWVHFCMLLVCNHIRQFIISHALFRLIEYRILSVCVSM